MGITNSYNFLLQCIFLHFLDFFVKTMDKFNTVVEGSLEICE